VGATPTSTPSPTSTVASSCLVSYVVTESPGTFTVMMTVVNTSTVKVKGWTLRWAFPPGQQIIYGLNAMVTNDANGGVATDIGLNRVIIAGGSTTVGFVGARKALVPTPTSFTLNGAMCH
jgi:hypothetical protein